MRDNYIRQLNDELKQVAAVAEAEAKKHGNEGPRTALRVVKFKNRYRKHERKHTKGALDSTVPVLRVSLTEHESNLMAREIAKLELAELKSMLPAILASQIDEALASHDMRLVRYLGQSAREHLPRQMFYDD